MQTLVLATDFSEASENAYRYCLELASKKHTQIYVAHIYRHQNPVSLTEDQRRRYHQKKFEEFRQRTIRFSSLYPDLTTPDLLTHCHVSIDIEEGYASTKLLELAQRHDADLLILGAKRHPGLFKKLFGQVSQKLIHAPSCSVLVVPEEFKGGYPERVGVLCLDKQDEDYLSDWVDKKGMLNEIDTEYFLLHDGLETSPSSSPDGRQIISRDGGEMLVRLEEAHADLFVIQSKGEVEGDRKSLIHFLYDHLSLPLICVHGIN